ncbi:MAG TPA: OmpA family protein [Candidatus Baltobacteraceae bacterium]
MPQQLKTAARAAESRFRRRQDEQKVETAGMMRWLLTYADVITLMLALFIILFSMSTISAAKIQRFARQVTAGFDNTWSVNQPPSGGTEGQNMLDSSSTVPAVEKELQQYVARNHLQNQVQVHLDRRGLVITLLSDKSYYDSGSAELRPQTMRILDEIATFLRRNDNLIRVEGNTDDVPIATAAFPTNWELSTARAVNVVRYLHEHDAISPTRLSAAGYGEFHPRTTNATGDSRQQNRRVDVVLLNASISAAEKGT